MLLASCKVLLASCKVPLASCKVPLASYKVPLASCKVPLASCKVGLASCKAHLRMSDQRCPLPYICGRQPSLLQGPYEVTKAERERVAQQFENMAGPKMV